MEELERQLKGSPSALGRLAIPWAVVFSLFKFILFYRGFQSLRYLPSLFSYHSVSIPNSKQIIMWYAILQSLDETKSIYRGDKFLNHFHHVVTGLYYLAAFLFGGERTLGMCSVYLVVEVVAPLFEMAHLARHLRLGCTRGNVRLLRMIVGVTWFFRMPLSLLFWMVVCRDVARWWREDEGSLEAYGDLQIWASVPGVAAGLMLLWLDVVWTVQICAMIRSIESVLEYRRSK